MNADPEHKFDKLALFLLAGLLVVLLCAISAGILLSKHAIPSAGVGLLGTIVGGVITQFNSIIKLVQVSWESGAWSKMTESLAASGPAVDPDHPQPVTVITDPGAEPQEVKVVNEADAPVPTTMEDTTGSGKAAKKGKP